MHACLRAPELLLNIFNYVHDDEVNERVFLKRRPRTATLPALARACKDFTEPALDITWRSLPSLVPLLACIPLHRWTREDNNYSRRLPLSGVNVVGALTFHNACWSK